MAPLQQHIAGPPARCDDVFLRGHIAERGILRIGSWMQDMSLHGSLGFWKRTTTCEGCSIEVVFEHPRPVILSRAELPLRRSRSVPDQNSGNPGQALGRKSMYAAHLHVPAAKACTDVRVVVLHVHKAALKNMPPVKSIRKGAQSFHCKRFCGMLTIRQLQTLTPAQCKPHT